MYKQKYLPNQNWFALTLYKLYVCFETSLISQLTTPNFVTDFNFELPQAGIRGSMK